MERFFDKTFTCEIRKRKKENLEADIGRLEKEIEKVVEDIHLLIFF